MKTLERFVIGLLVITLLWSHAERKIAQKENQRLTNELKIANDNLDKQVALLDRIEAATVRLEIKEQERQVQYDRFETRLKRLATQNEKLRSVLSVVVPVELLHGLRSFRTGESQQGAK